MPPPATPLVCALALALAGLPAGASARAGDRLLPRDATGFVALSGGWRLVPQTALVAAAQKAGLRVASHPGRPALQIPLSYRVDRQWTVSFEGGWASDRVVFDAGSLALSTVNLQFSVDWTPDLGGRRLEPFLGGGIGYYLSTVSRDPGAKNVERNATGGFLHAGVRLAIADGLGLYLEDRYAFASVVLDELGAASVGGNSLLLGAWIAWPGGGRD